MKKLQYKVIAYSVAAGIFAGLIDTLVSFFIFSKGGFWDMLILDVPAQELYVRTFLLLSFISFGFVISRALARRKRAEEELKIAFARVEEEKAKSEAIIAGIGDGISIQDTDFKILYQNQIHKSFVGEHLGDYCYEVYEHKDQVCDECPVAASFKNVRIHRTERTVSTSKGIANFEITASPLRDSTGEIIGGIEVVRDVTERKKLEDQLLHAQKMEAVGTLTGGIAHEFNNVLTAMIICIESLQDGVDTDSPLRPCIDVMHASADRAANLTKGLLAYGRKQVTNLEPVSINNVTEKVEGLLFGIIGENILVETVLTDENAVVMADAGQLEHVLMNLATNARDAMPMGGRLLIETRVVELDEEFVKIHRYGKTGKYAVLSVSDSGIGIAEQEKERIFEPFFTTKDVGKGTGLGLSMVYGIVKQHKGLIQVHSEPNRGTTFEIYLPVIEAEVAEKETTVLLPVQGGTETILLAEDDSKVREPLKASLEKYGYQVMEARDGEDALDKFVKHQDNIDLVLFDVVMPKKSGNEAFEEIEKIKPGIKALFMSGYADEVVNKSGIFRDTQNFVSKPVSSRKILRKVREILDGCE